MSVNNNLQTGSGRIRVARFTASGSWTAPAGVYSIRALAVGGGGGGGASRGNQASSAHIGGGGGGGGVIDELFPVVPGTTYTVTIGTGGAGANTSAAGSNGTDTTFGSLFTAPGGQGGVSYLLGTGYAPTTNPGGSMGGWGLMQLSPVGTSGGHGCGAGTPILVSAKSDALSVGDVASSSNYTYFDGYSEKTIPFLHFYESGSNGEVSDIAYNTISATTTYQHVKRNDFYERNVQNGTFFIPGYSYKGLGAGGQSLVTSFTPASPTRLPSMVFSEPSAGKLLFYGTPSTASTTNGTNGVANTGAGGGGSRSGSTVNTIASGGDGGSGYVEIVWQE